MSTPSQEIAVVVGRICCEAASGKLNKTAVMLEGSLKDSGWGGWDSVVVGSVVVCSYHLWLLSLNLTQFRIALTCWLCVVSLHPCLF